MSDRRFFIYARKSTESEDRQVRSIGDQLAELRDLARNEGLEVVEEFVESQTAKVPGRPVFNEMLERIEGGEASGVLAWHPDRLARNSLDGGRVIWLVDSGKITDLRFPTFRFEPTAQGKFMLAVMFGQSKYYVDNLSENIRRGHRHKLREGIWPIFAPLGYLNDRATRTIVPDRARAPLVAKAFELYGSGLYTLDQLREAVNGLGLTARNGRPLSRSQYHRLLRNPIYHGVILYKGELYEAKHEPLISKARFDKVQLVIGRKTKPKAPKLKSYLYRGLFRCGECGCFVTTETQKGHNYLRCTKRVAKNCSQRYVREEDVARQIAASLAAVAMPPEWADWMVEELQHEALDHQQALSAQVAKADESLRRLDEKVGRLTEAYLERTLSLEEFRPAKNKLVEEKQA
jgi:DNA invertase Pin-like site-specific DNA recombinase